ncbi:MAG: InlB B-repeat-containing protein, partial [Tannerella sp.]|nr:InlB B-repeat-containing protein [Tannerella sp.]
GTSVTATATPKNGYRFVRWTENGSQVSTSANYQFTLTANRTLVANFEAVTYTITYNLNGGSGVSNSTYTIESQTITLPVPTRTGYTFQGWYATSGFSGNPVANIPAGSTGDRTFYAKWQEIIPPSSDATLSGLLLSGGFALNPPFSPNVYEYAATVPNSVASITVTAYTNDDNAEVISGEGYHPLNVGKNSIWVTVRAADGNTRITYTITVTRENDTGNGNVAAENGITIYSRGSILNVKSATVMKSAEVYTITGNLVCLEEANSNEIRINKLPGGIYIIRIVLEGDKIEMKKVFMK